MNRRLVTNLLGGYIIGLGVGAIWYGVAYWLGRPYTGVPTGALWAAALGGSVAAFRVGWDETKRLQASLSLAASLLALGLIVIGTTALAGAQWDQGAPSPWFDAFSVSALLAALTLFGGRRTPAGR